MKRLTAALSITALVFLFGACKGGADDVAEQSVKMMEEMANIMETNKTDCDKMGEALDKLITSKKDLIEKAKKLKTDKTKSKELEKKYGDRLKAATKKMMGGAIKCMSNKKVGAAMKKMR